MQAVRHRTRWELFLGVALYHAFLWGQGVEKWLTACLGIICHMLIKQNDKLCKRSVHSYKLLNEWQESSFPQEVNPTLRKHFSSQEVSVVLWLLQNIQNLKFYLGITNTMAYFMVCWHPPLCDLICTKSAKEMSRLC